MARGDTATVTMQTSKGAITIKVEGALGPSAAGNFVALARCGFYEGVTFHRLVPGFVIQGGDGQYGKKAALQEARVGTGGPGYKFEDEPITGDYHRGTLAMANSGPNTNGSQFFICHQELMGRLPKNYTIFGSVTKGIDVVDTIAAGRTGAGDRPVEPVAMTSVEVHDD